jgi:hypothetical protein
MIAFSPLVAAPAPAVIARSEVAAAGRAGEREPADEVAAGVELSAVRAVATLLPAPSPAGTMTTTMPLPPSEPAAVPAPGPASFARIEDVFVTL